MSKTAEELKELRAVASAATQGSWHVFRSGVDTGGGTFVSSKSECGRNDAEHIATFDPPTVIALLDELKQLREFVADIASTACDYETTREHFANDPCRGRCDSCTARELLKGLNE